MKQKTLLQYRRNYYSQNGEDDVIEEIVKRLNIRNGFCVEFGAWDGKYLSNTYRLIKDRNWTGLHIEGDAKKFADLLRNDMVLAGRITPVNAFVDIQGEYALERILAKYEVPKEFELLSIDIDSYDYYVWRGLIEYRPKIVIIEINSSIEPYISRVLSNGYVERSFANMLKLGQEKGYTLVCHTGNMIFVVNELVGKLGIDDELKYPNSLFYNGWTKRQILPKNYILTLLIRSFNKIFYSKYVVYGSNPFNIYWDEHIEELYHIRWKVEGEVDILVTTFRPELLCASRAVLVNAEDKRYLSYNGKMAKIPLYNRYVKIISHPYPNPDYETGVVMTCSYADSADVALFRDLNLIPIRAIDDRGCMTEVSGVYAGMPAVEARKEIVKDLQEAGFLMLRKPITHL